MSFLIGDTVMITRGTFSGREGTVVPTEDFPLDDAVRYTVAITGGPNHLQYQESSLLLLNRPEPFKKGDKVRIVGPSIGGSADSIGEITTINGGPDEDEDYIIFGVSSGLYFKRTSLEKIVDEPESEPNPLTGMALWEMVELVSDRFNNDPVKLVQFSRFLLTAAQDYMNIEDERS